ncbi:sugar phosphate isomerase/epimerase family protein [Vallitalea guaymasensis]|uniref:sugar phosphate isomerase/epimerase family protein n=1 Tax=Vallitalea guaymasensis TaxID=1185412 RepID=UPI000DE31595|nr:sugar phosphate isomerase/epimerase family protein [Vallitalea guaymasensis]
MSKFILSAFSDEASMDLTTQLDVLQKHGIEYMEMRGVNDKNVADLTLEEAGEIKKELDKSGIKVSAIGSPIGKIGITDSFEPHLDKFKHVLELSKILDTKYIRMFSFFIPEGEDPDDYKDETIRRWKGFLEAAKDYDVILLHENEKDIYGDIPRRCYELVKALKCPQFKLIYDFANFVQCDVENYPDGFDLLKDEVIYFHIKDALYKNHKVVPAGYGDGQLEEILREAKDTGYEGFLSLEPHLGNFKGFAELENGQVNEELEDSGPVKFAVAVDALKELLKKL